MIVCRNCGTENPEGSRFCSNCGTALVAVEPVPAPTQPISVAEARVPAPELPASAPEWRMSDPGPLPEPRPRRTWLWILLGLLGAVVLVCCLGGIWLSTAGRDVVCNLATQAAESQPRPVDDEGARQLAEFCNG